MNELYAILPLIAVMLASGFVSGIMAGLLGIGGGIVVVPILEFSLSYFGVDESIRMHIAIATSLAIIIITSISSARAHYKNGTVEISIVKNWAIAIFIGAIIGSWVASKMDGKILIVIFAFLAFGIALKMLFSKNGTVKVNVGIPQTKIMQLVPFSMGGLSSMMGIGGGVMGVSVMTLYGIPIHRAVSTASFFGFLISIPGTITFILSGLDVPNLPIGNLGYVNLVGLAIIAPVAYFSAPLGAKIAHQLSQKHLNLMFGLFLLFVSSQMLYRNLIQ
ncbi:MAG: sulfite exporter TauE/SafE family protein [Proteobacteria bacterium]|jgi:uncharacterized protein|nr:sulfite exporter TauE/SafE family protein [Pseudomonadota bacterium]